MKKTVVQLFSAMLTACLLFSCSPETQDSTNSAKRPVIHFNGRVTTLPNPLKTGPQGSGPYEYIYDTLIEYNESGIVPWLAKSWDISRDGLTYTFHLQPDVLWQDGRPMTAEDIKFTFDYYRENLPVRNNLLVDGQYIITNTAVIDRLTVNIQTSIASSIALEKIGTMPILPKHIWENVDDPMNYEGPGCTLGCGPFMLDRIDPLKGLCRICAFDDYWGPEIKVAAIQWVPYGNAIFAFENKDVDIIAVSPDIVPRYADNPEYTIVKGITNHGNRLVFNFKKNNGLDDKTVRQAIAYGINRQEMVEKLARGAGVAGSAGTIPRQHPFYNNNIKSYPYDPDKARELLNGRTYTFNIIARSNMDEVKMAELMKLSLADVGIFLNITSVDNKTRNDKFKRNEYDMSIYRTGFGPDPDYLRSYYGAGKETGGVGGYYNKSLYDLGQLELQEPDAQKRREIILKMQEIIAEEIPMIVLYTTNENYVFRPAHFDGWKFRYDRNRSNMDIYKTSYLGSSYPGSEDK